MLGIPNENIANFDESNCNRRRRLPPSCVVFVVVAVGSERNVVDCRLWVECSSDLCTLPVDLRVSTGCPCLARHPAGVADTRVTSPLLLWILPVAKRLHMMSVLTGLSSYRVVFPTSFGVFLLIPACPSSLPQFLSASSG